MLSPDFKGMNENHIGSSFQKHFTQHSAQCYILKYLGSLEYSFLRIKLKLKIMVRLLFASFSTLDLRNDFTFCDLWRKMSFDTSLFCVDDISRVLRSHPGYRYIIMWQKWRGMGLNLTATIFESGPMPAPWKTLPGTPLLPSCKLG